MKPIVNMTRDEMLNAFRILLEAYCSRNPECFYKREVVKVWVNGVQMEGIAWRWVS